MTVNGLHHAAISTPDIERLMNWYRENFGFEEVARTEWPKGSKEIDDVVGLKNSSAKQGFLKCGNIMIEFFEYSSPHSQPMEKIDQLIIMAIRMYVLMLLILKGSTIDFLKMELNFMLRHKILDKLKLLMEEIVMVMFLNFRKLSIPIIQRRYFSD